MLVRRNVDFFNNIICLFYDKMFDRINYEHKPKLALSVLFIELHCHSLLLIILIVALQLEAAVASITGRLVNIQLLTVTMTTSSSFQHPPVCLNKAVFLLMYLRAELNNGHLKSNQSPR